MRVPNNRHGGLTLVPMPGFEGQAERVKDLVTAYSRGKGRKFTPVDVAIPDFGAHANDEPYLGLGKKHVGDHDCVVLASGPGTPRMLWRLNMLLNHIAGRRGARLALVTGYFPLCRSDKDEGGEKFALPRFIIGQMMSAAEIANGRLDRIIAVDLHSPQMVMAGPTGLITELTLVRRVLMRAIQDAQAAGERVCLAFPDDGSAKRTGEAVDLIERELGIHLPVVCGIKRRKSSTEADLKMLFGDTSQLRDATVFTVDDEITTAGTNIKAARVIKTEYGARNVHAVVTHAVLSKEAPQLLLAAGCPVDRTYAADTIPVDTRPALLPLVGAGKLVTVEWASDLAASIYHHHWGLSIRELR